MTINYRMFIDDIRCPKTGAFTIWPLLPDEHWYVVRSTKDAISCVLAFGPPQEISFDHDLGGEDTSIEFIKWLIDYIMDHPNLQFPKKFNVHSANPVGSANIKGLMDNFIQFYYGD